MKTRDEQANEYAVAKRIEFKTTSNGNSNARERLICFGTAGDAFLAGWDAALKSQWRDASEERPAHLQRCFCYDKHMPGVYCYVYDDIDKYWCNQYLEEHDPNGDMHVSDYADYRVTHWMPIPDLP